MAHWPIRSDTRLNDAAQRELRRTVELARDLDRVITAALLQQPASKPDTVFQAISTELEIPLADLRTLFNSLENIRLVENDQGSLDSALDRVRSGLSLDDVASSFDEARPLIRAAAERYDQNNPVALSYKAQRLIYLRERLYHDAEIITDARPVFNEAGEEIVEFIVTHELVLTHFESGDIITRHMSMDNADIVNLRRTCERAIIKARTLKEALGTSWKTEVLRDDAEP